MTVPSYCISVINHTFRASDHYELSSFEDARAQAIKAALEIGSDEVANGTPFFGAEVVVEEGEEILARFVVSIGASSLK